MIRQNPISLEEIAYHVMIEKGFLPQFPEEVERQVNHIDRTQLLPSPIKDKTALCWISIDNDDSLDLDQLTYAEMISPTADRIYVAIADVNYLVKKGSPIDRHAAHNTTSVYTPSKIFPMLPLQLSTNFTSLNQGVNRNAVVVEVDVDSTGKFKVHDIYAAMVRNRAKLAYNSISAWLDGKAPLPEDAEKQPDIQAQLLLQDGIAARIKKYRDLQGSLSFITPQLAPVVSDGIPVKLEEQEINRGRVLIENFMIATNIAMTTYMTNLKIPTIQRVVRVPKRWDRITVLAKGYGFELPAEPDVKGLQQFLTNRRQADPEHFADLSLALIKLIGKGEYIISMPGDPPIGHFDLALSLYSHTTAPNRRYPDLIMQRLLKHHLEGLPSPYSFSELQAITERCTQKENDAAKVERRVLKSAAAMVLENQIGRTFPAMITGINQNGTWVRLLSPPIEGKLIESRQDLDVGDTLKVELIQVDVPNGYIDFAEIEN